jgi:hypothetical protein
MRAAQLAQCISFCDRSNSASGAQRRQGAHPHLLAVIEAQITAQRAPLW